MSDVDLRTLLAFHRAHEKLVTLTAVHPPSTFGHLNFVGDQVVEFDEKPHGRTVWINGGFFAIEPGVFDSIGGDDVDLSRAPLENLANDRQFMAFRHLGFWQCLDTTRDKEQLETRWKSRAGRLWR